jgi:hypothetical protein
MKKLIPTSNFFGVNFCVVETKKKLSENSEKITKNLEIFTKLLELWN